MNSTAAAPTASSKFLGKFLAWAGPCASFLCLIHCVAMGVLAVLAPAFLTLLPHAGWIEGAVLAFSFVMGLLSMRRLNALPTLKNVFYVFGLMGFGGFVLDSHPVFHGALVAMAALQIYLLARHSLSRKTAVCCDHAH